MARPTKGPPVPSALVPALVRLVRERDAEGAALLALRLGIEPAEVDADEVAVAPETLEEALEAAADALSEPNLALRLPADLRLRRYGLAELAARSATTVREGLSRMARYAPLVHPAIACALEETPAEAIWRQRTPSRPRGIGRHAHEYALAYVLTCMRRDSGAPLALTRAWFAHPRPRDLGPLHRFFATQAIDFGCEDSGFALAAGELDLALATADPRLLVTADELADAAVRSLPRSTDLAGAVGLRVEALLPGEADIEAVATAMHMSVRTLQRKLDAEGASFSEIVDEVRHRLACRWLADDRRTLSDVAFSLGFSDLATFSRAFKRWTGKPPGAWRLAEREG
jgi:AraC-like DNA-binding protein